MTESLEQKKQRALLIIDLLSSLYPDPKTELTYSSEMELAVAVMLSAQTTDKKVNEITPKLFTKYKSWEDLACADLAQLQQDIRGVNFHLGKADRIIKAAKVVLKDFKGQLPKTVAELIKIPGIARKSANVIQQELWGIAEGIVVDTHVSRVSNRLGLTANTDPVKIEKELMEIFPKSAWRHISGAMVLFGRYVCKAKKPDCVNCNLKDYCPSAFDI